ncbi:MAG: sigma-70 family RNA polymerase sigma factor [Planctomycetota bacterium]|nr:sigma-70 family RNA polymerase sigma factor [Planctomycetota bacterium]
MQSDQVSRITGILNEVKQGDRSAWERLLPMVYGELHQIAEKFLRRERSNHTLQPTALVHEAFLKLVDQSSVDWKSRAHFFAISAQAMRRILVDHARGHQAAKRGGGQKRITLDENLIAETGQASNLLLLEDALTKLALLDPRQAKIVELRFFGGLTVAEVAEVLQMSKRSVEREWTMVRSWLRRELSDGTTP